MNRWLALALALAGCDQVYGLMRPPVDAHVDVSSPSDDVIDTPPGLCDLGAAGPANPIPAKGIAIVAGKFDADDRFDVAVGSTTSTNVMFRFNDNGDFSSSSDIAVGETVLALATGDIDHNGSDDVAFVTATTANALLQTPTSWDRRMITVTGGAPRSVVITNFDGGDLDDLLVTVPTAQQMKIYWGGSLMYTPGGNIPTTGAMPVATALLNVDNDTDVDVAAAFENGIILYRDAGTNFAADPPLATGMKPNSVAAAKLGDRMVVDLVVLNHDSRTVTIVRNSGSDVFAPATTISTGESPRGLALADMNADGFTDILFVSNKDNTLGLIRGTATGFEVRRDYATVTKPVALAVADFTGDGRLDVAVLGEDDGFVVHPTTCQ